MTFERGRLEDRVRKREAKPVGNVRGARGARFGGRDAVHSLYQTYGKRAFDLLLVVLAAPAWVPLIALLALAVKADGGPALYSQPRVGIGARSFRMWKLRTMVVDADDGLAAHLAADPKAKAEWDEKQKLTCDPRVTTIGKFLRKTSLDELPQLWNVLVGEMSLVGPRPMMVQQKALYPGDAYYQMRPGITGLWQVSARNAASVTERADYDEDYFERQSIALDVGLLLRTVNVVLKARGV